MEVVLFVGIQASGKSSFYQKYFSQTHLRINRDMLKTRHREKQLIQTCLEITQSYVIDNTNVEREIRAKYIQQVKEFGYRLIGYYFQTSLEEALKRNQERKGKACIPEKGVRSMFKKLEIPNFQEGFDQLFTVSINEKDKFEIQPWDKSIETDLSR